MQIGPGSGGRSCGGSPPGRNDGTAFRPPLRVRDAPMDHAPPTARLRILQGPGAGEVFPLSGSVRIGRGTGGDVRLVHPSVSRDHAVLEVGRDSAAIRDVGSLAGTALNDQPVKGPTPVRHGDLLEIGVFRLVFERDTAGPEPADPPAAHHEVQASVVPAAAFEGAEGPAAVLYRLSLALLGEDDPELLADKLLAEVLAALPGDTAAVVACDPLSGKLELRRRRDRDAEPGSPADGAPRISRSLVARALAENRALLVDDTDAAPTAGEQTSMRRHQIRSAMAAPLPLKGRRTAPPPAALCVVSRRFSTAFNEASLRLLATMGNLAGPALSGAEERRRLLAENAALKGRPALSRIVTADPKMRDVLAAVLKVAVLPTTVLVTGETGTGKELVAAALHENSLRCGGPLVKVNCAAISESLLESELFGHEKGAFTDARSRRIGKLEAAHGGTLFLDEVGEMSPAVQAKLLRAVENREFERLGGNSPVRVDVRFVAATHRDLAAMVREGRFREDLYYRLSVMPVRLPSLRERTGDLALLAGHFARECAAASGGSPPEFAPDAIAALRRHNWPGNVRELRNLVERLCILRSGSRLGEADIAEALGLPAAPRPTGDGESGAEPAVAAPSGAKAPVPGGGSRPGSGGPGSGTGGTGRTSFTTAEDDDTPAPAGRGGQGPPAGPDPSDFASGRLPVRAAESVDGPSKSAAGGDSRSRPSIPGAAGEGGAEVRRLTGEAPTVIRSLAEARAAFEAEHVRRALEAAGGNISEAARKLGMTREALSRRIHRDKPAPNPAAEPGL